MVRRSFLAGWLAWLAAASAAAQVQNFKPVTNEMLQTPSPHDWLMFSRTYDAQRFSPLDQINRRNVGGLRMAWVRGMGPGQTETIPIVHEGVMYVVEPGAVVAALRARREKRVRRKQKGPAEARPFFMNSRGRAM